MNSERWNRLKVVFQEAVGLQEKERQEYLQRACSGDASLRAEVEMLLAESDSMPEEYLKPPIECSDI